MTILDDIDALADGAWEMTRDELIAAVSVLRKDAHASLHIEYRTTDKDGRGTTAWGPYAGTLYGKEPATWLGGKAARVSIYDERMQAHLATEPWAVEDIYSVVEKAHADR
jgi:hypothetical protein